MATLWVFPGQGVQQVGMGRQMAERYPTARAVYEEASAALGWNVARLCWEGPEEALLRTEVAQPALVTTCLACLAPFREAAERPGMLAGHSVGEYTALIAAGALSLADGLRLVARRGELMEQASRENPGGMAALLGLDTKVAEAICEESGATLANRNAPGQVVVSGPPAALSRAMALARERGARRVIPLKVSGAFHSPCMASAAEALRGELERIAIRPAEAPVIANLTARPVQEPAAIRAALGGQLAGGVRWEESVRRSVAMGATRVIEFGPGGVLAGMIRRIDPGLAVATVADPEGVSAARGQAHAS